MKHFLQKIIAGFIFMNYFLEENHDQAVHFKKLL